MSIVSYIVMAVAVGIVSMMLFRRCADATPVRLSVGLVVVLVVSVVHATMFLAGGWIGQMLRFNSTSDPYMYADRNAWIMLGLFVIVAMKLLFPYMKRTSQLPLFSLADSRSVLAMSVATGINVFLLGIGAGFVEQGRVACVAVWLLLVADFLLGYVGVMFGRRKVELRPRRWMIIACIMLVGVAIAAVMNV